MVARSPSERAARADSLAGAADSTTSYRLEDSAAPTSPGIPNKMRNRRREEGAKNAEGESVFTNKDATESHKKHKSS